MTDTSEYTVTIDALHRNHWPVVWNETNQVIGEVVEHITLALDGGASSTTCWSWTLHVSDGPTPATVKSTASFRTLDDATAALAKAHRDIYGVGAS